MIRRTYFVTCDICKDVLKDELFNQYLYCDSLVSLENELISKGWITEIIFNSKYKKDICPKCQ